MAKSKLPETPANPSGEGVEKKSWAEVASTKKRTTSVNVNTLPSSTSEIAGIPVIDVSEIYEECIDGWKYSLVGRLDFRGLKFGEVKKDLEEQWGLGPSQVKFYALKKGFFMIRLACEEHKRLIKYGGVWMLDHIDNGKQILKVVEWDESFDPDKLKQTHATVWVNFPNLKFHMWTEKMLLSLGKVLGTPVVVAKPTLEFDLRYPAAVLVDIDYAKIIPPQICVLVNKTPMWQDVSIPSSPIFCNFCKVIGHHASKCREVGKAKQQEVDLHRIPAKRQSSELSKPRVAAKINTAKATQPIPAKEHEGRVLGDDGLYYVIDDPLAPIGKRWKPTGKLKENEWVKKNTSGVSEGNQEKTELETNHILIGSPEDSLVASDSESAARVTRTGDGGDSGAQSDGVPVTGCWADVVFDGADVKEPVAKAVRAAPSNSEDEWVKNLLEQHYTEKMRAPLVERLEAEWILACSRRKRRKKAKKGNDRSQQQPLRLDSCSQSF